MSAFLNDLRRGARRLHRTPAFTSLAVLMLGVGLGANTAMFSVVSAVWLRPLPYASPDRLVAIEEGVPGLASIFPRLPVNAADAEDWRQRSRTFEAFTLLQSGGTASLTVGAGTPQPAALGLAGANFFSLLGVRPQIGRLFAPGDDRPGGDHVVVLSDRLWARVFNRDPTIIGRRVTLDGHGLDVIGVLDPDTRLPRAAQIQAIDFGSSADVDVWRPLVIESSRLLLRMSEFDYGCIGRMKPGVTAAEARDDLEAIEHDIARAAGAGAELHAVVTPLAAQAGARAHDAVVMLCAAVGAVLVIVCVNLSNAFLSRATGRQRELAIQAALGAGRARLVREALAESLVLSAAGAAAGLAFAAWGLRTVLRAAPLSLPDWRQATLDGRAMAFVTVATLILAAVIAALPAWKSGAADPQNALRSSDRSATDRGRGRSIRRLLIGVEVAMCTACLVVAGLLVSSFVRLISVDTGFQPNHGFVIGLSLSGPSAPDQAAGVTLARDLLARVGAVPTVSSAGVVNRPPLSGEGSNLGIYVESTAAASGPTPVADYRTVSEGYFGAMGIPLRSGRLIRDGDGDHPVGLVSEMTAAKLWPGENAIGRRFHLGAPTQPAIEVVGIVGDVLGVNLQKAPNLTVYVPFWQIYRQSLALAVRTTADPESVMPVVGQLVQRALPDQPAPRIRPLNDLIDATVVARRFQLNVVSMFALAGLLLAAMGVYTVIAQSMARRTRELGIRIALGAGRTDVWQLVGAEGLEPVAGGLVVGLVLAVEASHLVQGMLFGLSAYDWPTYAVVIGVMLVTAAGACAWPAYRACRIDPLMALREL